MSLPLITTTISVLAFCLGVFNFTLARRAERKKTEMEVGNLLDRARNSIYGPGGYSETGDESKFYDAESAVAAATLLDSMNPRITRYQGLLFEVKGNAAAAVEKYKQAVRLDPRFGRAHESLGRLLEGDEAIASLKCAIDCDPKEGWPHYRLACLLQKRKEISEAALHFQKAVNLQPRNAQFLVSLAQHLNKMGSHDQARDLYEKAISVNPAYVDALVGLGCLIINKGSWDEGISWIEEAMRANPTDSYPYEMIAAIYADKKEPDKALEYVEKAARLNAKCRLSSAATQEMAIEMKKMLREPRPVVPPVSAISQRNSGKS